jgi:hypothetical protein
MAQRGAWTPQKVRDRIRVSMLVKRLTDHVVGKNEMSQTQLKAAEILLKKSLPDLSSVDATLRGDADAPLALELKGSDVHG